MMWMTVTGIRIGIVGLLTRIITESFEFVVADRILRSSDGISSHIFLYRDRVVHTCITWSLRGGQL